LRAIIGILIGWLRLDTEGAKQARGCKRAAQIVEIAAVEQIAAREPRNISDMLCIENRTLACCKAADPCARAGINRECIDTACRLSVQGNVARADCRKRIAILGQGRGDQGFVQLDCRSGDGVTRLQQDGAIDQIVGDGGLGFNDDPRHRETRPRLDG